MRKSRKFLKNGFVAAADSKFTGEEPTWQDAANMSESELNSRFTRGLNFYNYYLDADDYVDILEKFMINQGYNKNHVKLLKKAPRNPEFTTAGKIARMINMGMPDEYGIHVKTIRTRIDNLLAQERNNAQTEQKVATNKPSVHDIMSEKVRTEVLCELEGMLDEWITNTTANINKINIVNALKGINAPASALKPVAEWITRRKDEYTEAYDKTDPDLVEGYSYLSKPALRKRIQLLDSLLADLDLYKGSKKATRKARAKKTKSADKLIARLKYLNNSSNDDYNLTSINPILLIGAQTAFLFNEKYRRLIVLKAEGRDGLTVSGTSIKNFNENESFAISLRKPGNVLPDIVTKTETQITKVIESLTTKKAKANGRVNENTLILRVL